MSEVKCPACGSQKLERSTSKRIAHLTLGGAFDVEEENYKCLVCGEEGDFALKNDVAFSQAEKRAEAQSIPKLVEGLNARKISMARFERAFELPQRTVNRWKAGDFSATSMALLRTVSSCPWLVDVAENGFDPNFAAKEILTQAVQLIGSAVQGFGPGINGAYLHKSNTATFGMFVATEGSVVGSELNYNGSPLQKVSGE